MPRDPEFHSGSASPQDEPGGILYTAEYQTNDQDLSQKWKLLHDVDIPCVLCQRIAVGSKTLMVGLTNIPIACSAPSSGTLYCQVAAPVELITSSTRPILHTLPLLRQVPGRNDCPSGFNRDYYGMLFSTHTSHTRGEHVCIDDFAEGYGNTQSDYQHML